VPLPRAVQAGDRGSGTATSPVAALRASSPALRAVLVVAGLNAVLAALTLALLPLAERVWAGGGAGFGPAVAVLGLGALGAPLLWWLGSGAAARTRRGLLLLAVALAVTAAGPAVGWVLVPLAVAGAASVHVEASATGAIQDGVPDGHRAGVLGLTDSVMVAAAMLASLVAPWAASVLGPRGLVAALAGACVAMVLLPATGRAVAPSIPGQRLPGQLPAAPGERLRSRNAPTTQTTRTPAPAPRPARTPTPATSPATAEPSEPAAVFTPASDTNTMARSSGGE
jgi:hypothetical protein